MSVELKINLARISAKPPLKALADVTLQFSEADVTIRRCAVFEKSGQPPWARLPSILIDKNGKRTYAPFIDLPGDLKKRILDALLTEFRKQSDPNPTS